MLLSVLLCLSMLLISCSQASNSTETAPETTATPTPAVTDYPVPEDVKIDYAAILAKWSEYITFNGVTLDTESLGEINYKFDVEDGYSTDAYVTKLGSFYLVTIENSEYNYFYDRYDPSYYTYKLYNIETGDMILTRSLSYDATSYRNPTCTIRPMSASGINLPIIEVKETRWVTETDENGYDYETEVTYYSYYDEKGTEIDYRLPADERKQAYYNVDDNTVRYEDDGKVYVYDYSGKYLVTYNKGEEKLIPNVDCEYGDFLYVFQSDYVYVLDKNYEKLCEYKISNDYDSFTDYTLENGNLLFVYTKKVSAESQNFDYEDKNSDKYIQQMVLLDVKTGKTTELERDFVIFPYDVITQRDSEIYGMEFKGENQLAFICKINDGLLSNQTTIAILDNEINIVAELPAFVKTQFGTAGMIDETKLLIYACNYDETQTLYYTVDVKDATVALGAVMSGADFIDGGFIIDERLYNFDSEMLADLRDYENYTLYKTFILLENEEKTVLAYILDGKLITKTLAYGDCAVNVSANESVIIVKDIYDYDDHVTSASETVDYNNSYYSATYKVYNVKGELLNEFYREIVLVSEGDGYAWIKYMDGNGDDGSLYILK